MKRKINKIISLILVFCIMVSLVTVTGISANAATNNEVVSGALSGDFSYGVHKDGYARITGYYGTDEEIVIPSTIDGYTVKYIGRIIEEEFSVDYQPITDANIKTVIIPDTVTEIYERAFDNPYFEQIYIPKSVTCIGYRGVSCSYATTILTNVYYEGSEDDWAKLDYPFVDSYWFNMHFNCTPNTLIKNSTIESDKFELTLSSKGATKEFGEIALPAGTYKFNIRKGNVVDYRNGTNVLGYNKVINDSCVGSLTCSAKYKNKITLVATGGIYSFQLDNYTNKLIIKRTGDLPDVYFVDARDPEYMIPVNTIFTPIKGTSLFVSSTTCHSIGSYSLRISNKGNILGKETPSYSILSKDNPISLSKEYNNNVYFYSYTGLYTFIFDQETNQLSIKYINDKKDVGSTDTIHVTGKDFNLDLDDNNGESDIATGTITLKKGAYSFKLYNRGVACGSNSIYFDKGTRTLNPNFMLPSVLYASGGKYKFTFEKSTGRLFIHRA